MRGLPGRLLLPAVFIMVTLLLTGCGSRPYFVKRDMGIRVTIDWIEINSWYNPNIYIKLTLGNSEVIRLPGPASAWYSWPIGGAILTARQQCGYLESAELSGRLSVGYRGLGDDPRHSSRL